MSYNGSGTFVINSTGQPVVTGTVISSSTFNAFTADIGTGLSTAITKNGQTTTTALIPFAFGISAAVSSSFAAGTVAAPSIYLATDTGTGFYRIGANNNGYSVSGTKLLDFSSALLAITGAATVSTTLGVTGATTLSSALTYGGVTLSNAVTGTGNMVLSASPTLTGTLSAAAITASGAITNSLSANGAVSNVFTSNNTGTGAGVGTSVRLQNNGTNVSKWQWSYDGAAFTTDILSYGQITLSPGNNGGGNTTSVTVNTSGINGVLGGTTPAAASVTTLSASSGITLSGSASNVALGSNYISNGGTDAGLAIELVGGGNYFKFSNNGTIQYTGLAINEIYSAGAGRTLNVRNANASFADYNIISETTRAANSAFQHFRAESNGVAVFQVDGTGALTAGATTVTTLTASGATNLATAAASSPVVTIGGTPSVNAAGFLRIISSNTATNWEIATNQYVAGLSIVPSTTLGGSTFTTPVLDLLTTGASITGTLGVTGTSTLATVNASGAITTTNNSLAMGAGGTSAGVALFTMSGSSNAGGGPVLRMSRNSVTKWEIGTQSTFLSDGSDNFNIYSASTLLLSGTQAGAVTIPGTLGVTGALAIGNTVASAIAVASTHKVTIVIGGVTYYLLASNV